MSPAVDLTELQIRILRAIPGAKDAGRLAKSVGIAPVALGMEIAKLQLKGYVADDGTLTEKGAVAVQG